MSISLAEETYCSINPEIRALNLDRVGKNLLVGTIGSEIYELSIEPASKCVENWRFLVRGNASLRKFRTTELRGIAIVPNTRVFVTVSEDSKLRLWDLDQRIQLQVVNLESKARVVEVDETNQQLVIGFTNGTVQLVNRLNGMIEFSRQEFETPVTVVRLSPDQSLLAAGSEGGIVKVYKFPSMRSAMLLKHSSAVTNLDWATSSKVLQTNTKDHKLLFWNTVSGVCVEKAIDCRDENWATWTCLYGWPVKGIMYKQKVPITSCARSFNLHNGYQLLAAGDMRGDLKLYRYPCIQMEVMHLIGRGHSSPISSIRFTRDDKYILTTGLYDGCVLQWEIS
eukprot:TRINITY_DN17612_c0_g2_i2.p1 TRINITY_DN17612_c0_g2~~TRINITY_DN17612_c0_g2_i2.p1  ORF type:complete len:338 (+),score=76.19 TRINITY_DN17612_c0_g2_i2:141-1154(+)